LGKEARQKKSVFADHYYINHYVIIAVVIIFRGKKEVKMVETAKLPILEVEDEEDNGIPADWISLVPQGEWTYEAYAAIPDDGNRYEIIDGVLYLMASPNFSHQSIVATVLTYLILYVQFKGLGRVIPAPFDVKLDLKTTVQPDVLVILNENSNIITEAKAEGAPDLVVEVASPSTAGYDRKRKRQSYAKAGVKEYWIVRPKKRSIELFVLEQGELVSKGIYKGKVAVPTQIIAEFPVEVEQFFA
jgi:Uma2 family endonuclease